MLFGTAKNIAKQPKTLNVIYRNKSINATISYKYLGVDIDRSLNLNSNFDRTYKKACGRLKLLRKIRPFLNVTAAKAIYQGMVVPILTYCGILNLNVSKSRKDKLSSFHDRAMDIVTSNTNPELEIKTPLSINQIKACQLVRKCMDGNVCSNYINYFVKRDHNVATRNNGYQLELPKIRLEYSRGSFYYHGSKALQ